MILWEAAAEFVEAGGNMNPKDIEPAVLFSMLMAQQRRIDELEERLNDPDV